MIPRPAVQEERICLSELIGLPTNHWKVRRLMDHGIAGPHPYDPSSLVLLDHGESTAMQRREDAHPWAAREEEWGCRERSPRGWNEHLNAHRGHRAFQVHTWPMTREYGFSCDCEGHDEEWRITMTQIRQMMMAAPNFLAGFENMVRQQQQVGNKTKKRNERRAHIKAKALLYHNLTREQKWELRATDGFTIVGADGKQYRITKATASNVKYVENGVDVKSLCVVASGINLPVYDLMLAQKLMLECAPEAFWQLAVVTNLVEQEPQRQDRRHRARMVRAIVDDQLQRTG